MNQPNLWRSIFTTSRDGLFELSADGRLLDANPTMISWLGQAGSEVVGRPLRQFATLPGTDWSVVPLHDWSGFLRLHGRGGGRLVSTTITAIPETAPGPVRAVGVARDLPAAVPIDEELKAKVDELDTTRLVTLNTLARLAEFHDPDVAGHLERVRLYTFALAGWLAGEGHGDMALTESQVIEFSRCSILHDVGKVAIPEQILQKPGRLDPGEWELMKTHAAFGGQFLADADTELRSLLDVSATFLSTARDIAMCHHERYDGAGYPYGLKEGQIPPSARIAAVADVYDALTSVRAYKRAWTHQEARDLIISEEGRHFDPQVVAAFRASEESFASIYESMQRVAAD